ncbi:FAD binding domain-containing protein [Rhodocollybia butyracea]|uniref:FAD binding domain-containing protein n=1 Tax=Rhodocollybia butyracea TaxID=206335 RepID=A0A9P5PJ85_9AGAR|nr:FAD binding domain-containing protein [Rhodocollybia butyracea]
MPCYGRGCTMWPRTIELLDQLDLADPLIQAGVVTRTGLHFHDGHRVKGGLMYGSRMDKLGDTFFKFALHLRQRLIEEIFSTATSEEYGFRPKMLHQIEGYTIGAEYDTHPVTVRVRDLKTQTVAEIKCRYLVGADGGKSTVRKLADISFEGENTKSRWIRMDALVKTDMPNPRCLNSIDSTSHGQILWCPIDNGMTRIGYVFSAALIEKYGGVEGVTQDVAIAEARKALAPFELEFLNVEWFTIYGIGQRIAGTFCVDNRVFLAGDACHTHSSGSAQGLNTGIHDALRVQGFARKNLLDSYNDERRGVVQTRSQVIDNDKVISTLISGHYPPRFQGRSEPPRFLFSLDVSSSFLNSNALGPSRATIDPGERGPDVYLTSLGAGDPVRLQKILSNRAKFSIVVFAGSPEHTRPILLELRIALAAQDSFVNVFPKQIFQWFTVPAASGNGGQDILGCQPFGKVYLDGNMKAHEKYGVDVQRGAIIVFRPDGWVGTVVPLQGSALLRAYFEMILEV